MEFVVPFLMSMAAGLATGLGALLGVTNLARSARFFSGALGFSAGVMIYVSLVEILPEAIESVENPGAPWIAVGALFGGIVFAAVIDALVPDQIDPSTTTTSDVRLLRMGVFTAIAIALHNFPEGFATFLTALTDHTLAIPIVVAIAIHNIPEGLAVAVPILHATGSAAKAFRWALLSGLAEPAGAVLGYLILAPFMTPHHFRNRVRRGGWNHGLHFVQPASTGCPQPRSSQGAAVRLVCGDGSHGAVPAHAGMRTGNARGRTCTRAPRTLV